MRGYSSKVPTEETFASELSWFLEPSVRRRMWALMVFLQGSLVDCEQLQARCLSGGIEHILCNVLKLAPIWVKYGEMDSLINDGVWCPSHGQLAGAALACLSSVVPLRSVTSNADAYGPGDRDIKDLLSTRLLSMGLDNGGKGICEQPALQWLCLHIAGSVMAHMDPEGADGNMVSTLSPGIKKTIVRALYQCIQCSLQSHGGSVKGLTIVSSEEPLFSHLNTSLLNNPVTMSLVLDALACIGSTHLILYGNDKASVAGIPGKGNVFGPGCIVRTGSSQLSAGHRPRRGMSHDRSFNDDDNFLTLPEIFKWIAEHGAKQHPIVTASLCRFFGRIMPVSGDGGTAPAVVTNSVSLEVITSIILKCLNKISASQGNESILVIAMIALWGILHRSAKAKAAVKDTALYRLIQEPASVDLGLVNELSICAYNALQKLLCGEESTSQQNDYLNQW